jgi:hypothetical protein
MNTDTNEVILDSEALFGLEMNNYLNNKDTDWLIQKSQYKFCYVDFILINIHNLYSVYLEHKERNYKTGFKSYDSFFITNKKILMLEEYYKNCYLVFDFRKDTGKEEEFYWIKYDTELFNTYETDTKNRRLILKKDCSIGFDNLMKDMTGKISNINLDR